MYKTASQTDELAIGVSGPVLTTDGTETQFGQTLMVKMLLFQILVLIIMMVHNIYLSKQLTMRYLKALLDIVEFTTITGGTGGTRALTYDTQTATTGSGTGAKS